MTWLAWAVLLLLQNYSFTWVSRARNGDSLKEHVIAALCSNGVWFMQQIVGVVQITSYYNHKQWFLLFLASLWYTLWTVTGSIVAHQIALSKKFGQPVTARGVANAIMHELFSAKSATK